PFEACCQAPWRKRYAENRSVGEAPTGSTSPGHSREQRESYIHVRRPPTAKPRRCFLLGGKPPPLAVEDAANSAPCIRNRRWATRQSDPKRWCSKRPAVGGHAGRA